MKKALSYVWPFTKNFSTEYNGNIEVTWYNGKKVLDSENANYSFGSLEKVLDLGLACSHAERSSPILVLGLGGGSVLGLLREKYNFSGKITAVEIDPAIIDIAKKEFDIERYVPLEIICEDAYNFVINSRAKFGLVIIDIFIDVEVPAKFLSSEFIKYISTLLEARGEVLFNTGINQAHEAETDQIVGTENAIKFRKLEQVNGTNTLLLGIKNEI